MRNLPYAQFANFRMDMREILQILGDRHQMNWAFVNMFQITDRPPQSVIDQKLQQHRLPGGQCRSCAKVDLRFFATRLAGIGKGNGVVKTAVIFARQQVGKRQPAVFGSAEEVGVDAFRIVRRLDDAAIVLIQVAGTFDVFIVFHECAERIFATDRRTRLAGRQ